MCRCQAACRGGLAIAGCPRLTAWTATLDLLGSLGGPAFHDTLADESSCTSRAIAARAYCRDGGPAEEVEPRQSRPCTMIVIGYGL